LSADDREEIEDAKKTLLELLSYGNPISVEDFESEDASLPEVKGADLPGAIAAVKASLELVKDGKDTAVADRLPAALLPSLAKATGVPVADVRAKLAADRYRVSRVASYSTGKAAPVGSAWALVRYDVVGLKGETAAAVAVCVREGGVWKVFL
jgi:hypothetical protein